MPLTPEVPLLSYPTPNPADRIITELVSTTTGKYKPKYPGEAHENQREYPDHVFIGQVAIDDDQKWIREIYVNERAAQSPYNHDIGFVAQSASHPEYRRRYLVRRTAPTNQPSTRGLPLTAVVHLTITNAGSSYETAPTVAFSGGAGSGAAAKAFVFRGEVVALFITAEGSGYTSAPTVSFSGGGGTGAAATAHIQPTTAILVAEDFQRMPGEPADSLFLVATRIYKTLPGPEVLSRSVRPDGTLEVASRQDVVAATLPTSGTASIQDVVQGVDSVQAVRERTTIRQADGSALAGEDQGFTVYSTDARTITTIGTTFRVRPYGEALPAVGSVFGLGTITDRKTQRIPGSTNVLQIIEHWELPEPRVTYPEVAIPFPGIHIAAPFTVNSGAFTNTSGLRFPPPWSGDGITPGTVNQQKPRNRKVVGREVRSYSVGPSGWSPAGYQVYTPGTGSRLFNIPDNTVHGPIRILETDANGTAYVVENIPASSPSTYDARQVLTFPLGEQPIAGHIYERRVLQASEATSPYDFPDVQAAKVFIADGDGTFLMQPNPGGERLYLSSSNAGDTMQVTIYGKKQNAGGTYYGQETVTLSGTTPVATSATYLWYSVTQVHLASAPAGVISLRGGGLGAYGVLTISDVVTEGSRIEMGRTGLTQTYRFRTPCRAEIEFDSSHAQGDYIDVEFEGVTKRFVVDIDSAGTGFPADPGENDLYRISVSSPVFGGPLAEAFIAAMSDAWGDEIHTSQDGNDVTLTGIKLGLLALTDGVTNAVAFAFTIYQTGTTAAAYQVRRGYEEDGGVMSAEDETDALVKAINGTGNEGRDYGPGTVAHPDLSATYDFFGSVFYRVELSGRASIPLGATWVLSDVDSDPDIGVSAITDGSNGPLLVTVGVGETDVFEDINFDNTALVLAAAGWEDDTSDPFGAVVYNMPAYIGTVTTEAVATPGVPLILRMVGTGQSGMDVSYETSVDGTTWVAGVTTLPDIGGKRLYDIALGEASINFIRVTVTNTDPKARAVHLEVFYAVS